LGALALYIAFLTFGFLKKALKESAEAGREAAASKPGLDRPTIGKTVFSVVTWI